MANKKPIPAKVPQNFPPLESITRPTLTTEEAAFYCNRAEQTMRAIASTEPPGMPRPLRINGRLAWPTAAIKALMCGGA